MLPAFKAYGSLPGISNAFPYAGVIIKLPKRRYIRSTVLSPSTPTLITLFEAPHTRHAHFHSSQASLRFPRTVAPSSAGCNSFHSQLTSLPLTLNCESICMIASAICSKFFVASASIVGPAPDRQIPSRPGCDCGDIWSSTSARPGIKALR